MNKNKEFLSRKDHFKPHMRRFNAGQFEHFLKKLSSNSNIRVLEFTPYLSSSATLNPDIHGLPIKMLGSKIVMAMRGTRDLPDSLP